MHFTELTPLIYSQLSQVFFTASDFQSGSDNPHQIPTRQLPPINPIVAFKDSTINLFRPDTMLAHPYHLPSVGPIQTRNAGVDASYSRSAGIKSLLAHLAHHNPFSTEKEKLLSRNKIDQHSFSIPKGHGEN